MPLVQPFSGHRSSADWAFTGCEVVVMHEAIVANDEDGTEIAVCDRLLWSRVWPQLRRCYG